MKKKTSLFQEMASSSPPKDAPKRLVIREADNGFIVSDDSMYGPGPSKEHIYTSVDDLKKCIDEKFGKAKKG